MKKDVNLHNMKDKKFVIGIDYGTDSVRAILVDSSNGEEISSAVCHYYRWSKGMYCDPSVNRYRQHPLDYVESLEQVMKDLLTEVDNDIVKRIKGVSFDTTGSTPVLIDSNGTPLAILPQFSENPNAMFILWKDHTAVREAEQINALSKHHQVDYTKYEGGIYSSEWVWSKVLHILNEDKSVLDAAYSWVEHGDWMVALVTGCTSPEKMLRSRCTAGHKAMWSESWDGLPSEKFLSELHPYLGRMRKRLFTETYTGDTFAGYLTPLWASKLGLPENVSVSVSGLDAHVGAVGASIKPNELTCIIGTSTCDILISSYEYIGEKIIPGICGQVDGSVLPGMVGLEAGQSAFGDIYAWFKSLLLFPMNAIVSKSKLLDQETKDALISQTSDAILSELSTQADLCPLTLDAPVALDWLNGRRTPDADQSLKGAIEGLTLGTSAPMVFRAMVEATAFGSRAIVERFLKEGIPIDSVKAIGGIAQKSPFVMQTMADVLNMPISVVESKQTCASGAAMFAAVAAGIYQTVGEAQLAMGSSIAKTFYPEAERHKIYSQRYLKYLGLGQFEEYLRNSNNIKA